MPPVLRHAVVRHDWSRDQVLALFALPFPELMHRAATVHREQFDPREVQVSTLLSIKTGGCPEDCAYCPQAARYDTGLKAHKLLSLEEVVEKATAAKAAGATRFCMGAAWRSPKDRDLAKVAEMVGAVKALGMESCATLGMLSGEQAEVLKQAGLDYYNHNLDTAPEFYGEVIHTRQYQDRLDTLEHVRHAGMKTCCTLGMLKEGQAEQLRDAGLDYYNHNLDTSPEDYANIISTREYQDRLDTLERVRNAGMHVCCGGIVGMGESREGRAGLLAQLASLDPQPESVPINDLVRVEGTPLAGTPKLPWTEFVRTIAVARILMPRSMVRLSAGRTAMPDAVQALCFFAGANSIFYGEKLLTTDNPDVARDDALFAELGIAPG